MRVLLSVVVVFLLVLLMALLMVPDTDSAPLSPQVVGTPTPARDRSTELSLQVRSARVAAGVTPGNVLPASQLLSMYHDLSTWSCVTRLGYVSTCLAPTVPNELPVLTRVGFNGERAGAVLTSQGLTEPKDVVDRWLSAPADRQTLLGTWGSLGCAYHNLSTDPTSALWACQFGTKVGPTPTPNPRGPLPANHIMRIWVPGPLPNMTNADCNLGGTGCFTVIQVDYDTLNGLPFDPRTVTDYLHAKYCGGPGIMCEWINKSTKH